MDGRHVELDFSTVFDGVSHCCMLHKLKSISIGGHFLSPVSDSLVIVGSAGVWKIRSLRQLM